jgi:hypothetical protein
MVINSVPTGLCLSGNLPKLALSADADVRIRLLDGGQTILDETYTPGFDGGITLDLSELVHDALSFTMPAGDVFVQPALVRTFTLILNDDSHEFTAIRAGVKKMNGDAADFLIRNFLTAQEQVKDVTATQPEWLTYYAVQDAFLYIDAHAPEQAPEYIKVAAFEAGKAYTVDMRFDRLAALCSYPPAFMAACVVATDAPNGQRLTCKQYYNCINASPHQRINTSIHQLFAFENSLGGFDTVRCTGEAKTTPEYTPATAIINDTESAYRIDKKDARTQNTGWISKEAAQWLQDMFASRKVYRYDTDAGAWEPVIMDENPTAETSTREDMVAFEFTCRPALDKPYLVLHRIEETISAAWGAFTNHWTYSDTVTAAAWGAFLNRWMRIGYNDYSHDYSRDYNITSPDPPYLNVTPATVWLPRSAPEAQVQVASNTDWAIE